jgi:hypothetical protein
MAGGSGEDGRRSPMLSVCTERDCTAIVFGRGTCTDHDLHPVPVRPRTALRSRKLLIRRQHGGGTHPRIPGPLLKLFRNPAGADARPAEMPRTRSDSSRLGRRPLHPRGLHVERLGKRATAPLKAVNHLVQLRGRPPSFRGLRRKRDQWNPLRALRGHRLGNVLRFVEPDLPPQLLRVRSLRDD